LNVRAWVAGVILATALPAWTQEQPRDVRRSTRVGTATISGVVMTSDTPSKPIRRVRVTLNNVGRTLGHTAITNDEGEFAFTRLPPGRYLVAGVKEGFVTVHHGARRPNRPGVSIAVQANETRRMTLRMPVGGVITGTVTDPDGLPAPGISVTAMTNQLSGGSPLTLLPLASLARVTDDRGEYRIFGLPPGDYIIAARPAGPAISELQTLSQTEIRRALAEVRDTRHRTQPGPARTPPRTALAPPEPRRTVSLTQVLYPGTTSVARAATVTLGEGELRSGIDIQLQHVPIARVQGTVFAPNGPVRGISVSLFLPGSQLGSALPLAHYRTTSANPQGSFTFVGIPPGQYTLVARTIPRPGQADQWASTDIVVDGDDVANLALSLRHGLSISGRVEFDSEHPPSFDLSGMQVELPMQMAATSPGPAPRAALRLEPGGRFVVTGIVPGLYSMSDARGVRWPIGPWWLKSIAIGGHDIMDGPLDLKHSAEDAIVTFTDRTTELSGTVRDRAGEPISDGFVVVFAADRGAWFHGSRRVAGIQPSPGGAYRFRNLPAGDYFIIAHDDVEDGEWSNPSLLARLAPQALRITIAELEKKALDLVPAPR
jgi:hypothetical protein